MSHITSAGEHMAQARTMLRCMVAGLAATAVLTPLLGVTNALGLTRLNFGRVLGTVLAPDSAATRWLGWGAHFANGAVLGLAYGGLVRWLGVRPGPLAGAALGIAHAFGSISMLAVAPRLHPRPGDAGLRPFGPFAYGPLTVPAMLAGHAMYGGLVGCWLARGAGRGAMASRR